MNAIVDHTTFGIVNRSGTLFTDSKAVAQAFGKEHKHVLRDIRSLACSQEFMRSNFGPFEIKDLTGTSTSHIEMTKDGFMFLVMGYTGPKAAGIKEAYIAAFNAMEAELKKRVPDVRELIKEVGFVETLLEELISTKKQVKELKPKALGYDRLLNSDGLTLPIELGKAIGEQPKLTIEWLRRHRYVYGKGKILPYAKYDSTPSGKGYFRVVMTEEGYPQTYVTPKGVDHFAKLLQKVSVYA
jgi:Rha family phage regulatory protein